MSTRPLTDGPLRACVTVPGKQTWILADPPTFGEVMTNVAGLVGLGPLDDDGRAA